MADANSLIAAYVTVMSNKIRDYQRRAVTQDEVARLRREAIAALDILVADTFHAAAGMVSAVVTDNPGMDEATVILVRGIASTLREHAAEVSRG